MKLPMEYKKYRKLWQDSGNGKIVTKYPIHIDTDTVDSCNYSCSICHESSRKRTHEKINTNIIKQAIDDGVGNGLYSLNIGSVGEPYLEKDILFELVSHGKNKGLLDIFVHTNFSLLDELDIITTVESGITCLCIGVDAISAETYTKIRGGDFTKILNNIIFLNQYKKSICSDYPKIRISAVPCEANKKELEQFHSFWKRYADVVEIQNYRFDEIHKTTNICEKRIPKMCLSAWQRLTIWPSGVVTICCCQEGLSDDIVLGNVYKNTISELWNSKKLKIFRENMICGKFDKIPTCEDCLNRSFLYEPRVCRY